MITDAEVAYYRENGFVVVENVLSTSEVESLRRTTTEMVEAARGLNAHTETYDFEDSHTPDNPRVRRIKFPHKRRAEYAAMIGQANIVAVLSRLIGADIRFDVSKLNMKEAGFGAAVEWHQDWAFYPHTNDDLCAVGIMMDDCAMENGPLMCIPGSHKGPVIDHHSNGVFCGAVDPVGSGVDPVGSGVDFSQAVPLTGSAGSITVHHVRTIHGSAPNTSDKSRRLLLHQFRAADAWPILGFPAGWQEWNDLLVTGKPSLEPRLESVPVRLPLPPAAHEGSIYENQRTLGRRYFDTKNEKAA